MGRGGGRVQVPGHEHDRTYGDDEGDTRCRGVPEERTCNDPQGGIQYTTHGMVFFRDTTVGTVIETRLFFFCFTVVVVDADPSHDTSYTRTGQYGLIHPLVTSFVSGGADEGADEGAGAGEGELSPEALVQGDT